MKGKINVTYQVDLDIGDINPKIVKDAIENEQDYPDFNIWEMSDEPVKIIDVEFAAD